MLDTILRLIRTKAKDSRSWTSAVVRRGGGSRGETPPFSQDAGVQSFRSWVFAAATINANAVASLPLRLFVKAGDGDRIKTRATSRSRKAYLLGDGRVQPSPTVLRKAAEMGSDFEEVTDTHPVLQLLSRSNPYINGFDACVLRVVWQELCGNAYLHIVTDPKLGVPTQLWPMLPQWTRIIPCEERFVQGYVYGRNSSQETVFQPDEVIHFKRPNPKDLWYGMGKLEGSWGAAVANHALHEMDLATFENHARPDYLLSVKGQASEEEMDSLEERIRTKFKGPSKGGHFLVSTGDIDLKPLSFPPKDIVGREDIVEEIAACFGVPVSMLKANDPNLASAKQGFQSWREMTILPLVRMDEEVLNQRLLPLFDLGTDQAVLAYDNPVPADEQLDLTRRQVAVSGGWMTPNEARKEQGLEPLDDPHAEMLHVGGMPLGGQQQAAAPPAIGGIPSGIPPEAAEEPVPPDALPEAPIAPEGEPAPSNAVPAGEPVANTALNGAQISSLVALASSVQSGELPAESARAIASAAFPSIPESSIAGIFDPLAGRAAPLPAEGEAPSGGQPEGQKAADDCVSAKVRKLRDEGYPQDQAVAIAISMCEQEKRGKAISDINTKPPASVAANARRALEVREQKPQSERGMTSVGLARARDLANRKELSEQTIRRMVAYFDRHQSDKKGESWSEQGKGWQAWNGWGGDEGWAWAKRKVEEFERARGRKSLSHDPICEECGNDLATLGRRHCLDCLESLTYKNCGTGSGGFQPGNTCGEEEGGGSDDKEDSPSSEGKGRARPATETERWDEWEATQQRAADPKVADADLEDTDLGSDALGGDYLAQQKLIAAQRERGPSDLLNEVAAGMFADASDPSDDGVLDITVVQDNIIATDRYMTQKYGDDAVEGMEGKMLANTIDWALDDEESFVNADHESLRTITGEDYHDPAVIAYAGDKHYRWMNGSMRAGSTPTDSALEYVENLPADRQRVYMDSNGEIDEEKVVGRFLEDLGRKYEEEEDEPAWEPIVENHRGRSKPFRQAVADYMDLAGEEADNEDRSKVLQAGRALFDQHGKEMVKRMTELTQKPIPKTDGKRTRLVRGIPIDSPEVASLRDAMQLANVVRMTGFTSTTSDVEIARSFASSTIGQREPTQEALFLTINAKRGLAVNAMEEEVILPPGRFEVLRRREVRNHGTLMVFVELEQLDD